MVLKKLGIGKILKCRIEFNSIDTRSEDKKARVIEGENPKPSLIMKHITGNVVKGELRNG